MPDFTVTLKQQQAGGFWPFVRNTFALIGFGTVVVGLSLLDSPNPQGKAVHMIEAVGEGWRAYEAGEAGYRAKANPFAQAPAYEPLPLNAPDRSAAPVMPEECLAPLLDLLTNPRDISALPDIPIENRN